MAETMPTQPGAEVKPSARKAWMTVGLWPVGILGGIVVMYVVAALMGVTVEPASGHASLAKRLAILGISGLVWLIVPALAVARARSAANAGSRSGRVALIVSILLLLATLVMAIDTLVDPGNML